ncbi:MAG: SbmA/BacA-like family transporter [Cypionkella sp.]
MSVQDSFLLRFIRLAGLFWNSEHKFSIRKDTLLLVLLTIFQIGMAVVTTQWNADLFDALEQRSRVGIMRQVGLLLAIFLVSIAVTTYHLVVKRRLLIGWRSWLTEKVTAKWMQRGRHYQITLIPEGDHDNPDGRIAEDIRIATEEAIALAHSLFYSLLLLGSFSKILWSLSGTVIINLRLIAFPLAGYLVWLAIAYSLTASILGWWMGKALTKATHVRQMEEANYRHDLIKAQENSQAIAFLQGEHNEQRRFLAAFQAIIDTYEQQTAAWKKIQIFSSGYSVLSMAVPILAAAPRYIVGAITLGTLMQSVQAFGHLVSALSWPVNNMPSIAKWRASVERVLDLDKALDDLELDIACLDARQICLTETKESVLKLKNLSLANVQGVALSSPISYEIKAGERVLMVGDTGVANRLFQAIAGLWPWGSGHIVIPMGQAQFFMPPRPYLPTGTLLDAICYPKTTVDFKRADVERWLKKLELKELAPQLDEVKNWQQLLSRERQAAIGVTTCFIVSAAMDFYSRSFFDSLTQEGETQMLAILTKKKIFHQATIVKYYQPTNGRSVPST